MKKETVLKIREQYEKKEANETSELIALDKKVKKPCLIFTFIWGILGCLILGTGMCLAMKIIGNLPILGIIIGIVGIIMVSINYSLYHFFLKKRKEKYASKIIDLSNNLLHE